MLRGSEGPVCLASVTWEGMKVLAQLGKEESGSLHSGFGSRLSEHNAQRGAKRINVVPLFFLPLDWLGDSGKGLPSTP